MFYATFRVCIPNVGPTKQAAPALCWQTNDHFILRLPLKHTKKRTSVLTGKVPPAMTFFSFAVHLRDQRKQWQGGPGQRDVRRGVRRPGPEQSSADRHQGNPRERQHVRGTNTHYSFFYFIKNLSVVLNTELQFLPGMWFSMQALMGKDLAEMLLLLIPRALESTLCL